MSGNSILNSAKYSSNNTDEWYTTYETIEDEIKHYTEQFYGKTVLCNCDDPFESNFCYFFMKNFNKLHLKKLICTSYSGSKIDQIKNNNLLFLIVSIVVLYAILYNQADNDVPFLYFFLLLYALINVI